jgi:hypothetical protein
MVDAATILSATETSTRKASSPSKLG